MTMIISQALHKKRAGKAILKVNETEEWIQILPFPKYFPKLLHCIRIYLSSLCPTLPKIHVWYIINSFKFLFYPHRSEPVALL